MGGFSSNSRKLCPGAKRPRALLRDEAQLDIRDAFSHECEIADVALKCCYHVKDAKDGLKTSRVRTKYRCMECRVHLCPDRCFQRYHKMRAGLI